jgi:hypothetical protein
MAMALGEYRIQLLDRLKECSSPAKALELMDEARLLLAQSQLSEATLQKFWTDLREDLQILVESASDLRERGPRAVRISVMTVARLAIVDYLNQLEERPQKPDPK